MFLAAVARSFARLLVRSASAASAAMDRPFEILVLDHWMRSVGVQVWVGWLLCPSHEMFIVRLYLLPK